MDKREKLIKWLRWYADNCDRTNLGCQVFVVLEQAAEELEKAEPVKHGRWVADERLPWKAFCSECHHSRPNKNDHEFPSDRKYCPNCGAKMEVDNG